ncbi:MAG: DUF3052 domain-containing protein [Bacteroidota bacterium]|nr:DUF3052 domain-containing protein [Bacteroidota bacterium]MDP4231203.1 DUF3052 domain-containing protein [Bacteroidota bacterium]MDP4235330.1 DUF3052 domain-containing protein [Bacteroidota bacterium]
MAGYSGTPLVKKLGIKPGMKVCILNAPEEFWKELGALPEVALIAKPAAGMDFILYFADSVREYEKQFPKLAATLASNGMLWIGWPKKASKIVTDLSENVIRDFGLKNGLVDVKVCAITEKWSGLKFVIRVKDRKK